MIGDIQPAIILQAFLVFVLVFAIPKVYVAAGRTPKEDNAATGKLMSLGRSGGDDNGKDNGNQACSRPLPSKKIIGAVPRHITVFKEFYFKLQNLEQFPDILPQARDLLLSLLAETLSRARSSLEPGILSIDSYTCESLTSFIKNQDDQTCQEWEEYIARRRAGSPAEMFQNKEDAQWWLKQMAPVKYVDGAWLGHIHKVTTPFALRGVTKDAWQVMSEELGDGNPQMNHVQVYQELMADIDANLPPAHNCSFIHPHHGLDNEGVWKAAVAQLLISLFPQEFLPEILGFNLHFEGLTMETLVASKELEDLGLNPYYFVLHVSIDNAHSGHTAIALQAVTKYLLYIESTEGSAAVQQAWKRVQAGYILSKGLSPGPLTPSQQSRTAGASFPRNIHEAEVVQIFADKAPVAHKIHCNSRMWIGGRRLVDWLDPLAFQDRSWQRAFLDSLSNMRPWVVKGDSARSRLMQELQWGGKMFGSFTHSEVEAVRRWIDEMGVPDSKVYWAFTGREEVSSEAMMKRWDVRVDNPVLSSVGIGSAFATSTPSSLSSVLAFSPCIKATASPDFSRLLPLWFASPCLLESFVSVPAKTTSTTASSVVRLLRAQSGFDVEGEVVAGMDEACRMESAGIVELGMEMIRELGLPSPADLKQILETWPSQFAVQMLQLSGRPMANGTHLLGMAWAFVGLHDAMASSALLSGASQTVLAQIAARERKCLETCLRELKHDKNRCADIYRGYHLGRAEIESCFR